MLEWHLYNILAVTLRPHTAALFFSFELFVS